MNYSSPPSLNISAYNSGSDPTLVFGPQRDSLYIVLPITIIYIIIFVLGIIGNLFTCIVIVREKSMRTATNYYLFSLAVSDLLLLVSGMPPEIYSIWSKWPYVFGQAFCVLRGLAAETSTNASVLTITLFTMERYLAICHPFVSHKMSKLSRAIKHILLLWIAAFILALPLALQFGLKNHKGVIMCLQTRIIISHSFEISTFLLFFVPLILITVLYLLIGLRLSRPHINTNQERNRITRKRCTLDSIHRKSNQSVKRVIKMLVAVVVAFFICWAPFHAQRLVAIYGTNDDHSAKSSTLFLVYSILTYISGIFYYMSTCINPIFYNILSNKFRDSFKNTISQWCCRTQDLPKLKRNYYTTFAVSQRTVSNESKSSNKSLGNDSLSKTKTSSMPEKTYPSNLQHVRSSYKKEKSIDLQECELKIFTHHYDNCT